MGITDSIGRGFGLTGESIGKGFEFAKANWAQIYKYLLLSQVIVWAFAALGGLIFVGLLVLLSQIDSLVPTVIGGLIFAILLLVGMTYGIACSFGGTQFSLSGKKVGYFEGRNLSLAGKWLLLVICAFLVAAIVIGGIFYAGSLLMTNMNPVVGVLILVLAVVLLAIFAIFVWLSVFYAVYEMAIAGKGPVDAVTSSFRLMKENFWETVVFIILLGVMGIFLYFIVEVIYYIIYFVAMLAALISPIFFLIGIVVAFIVMILLRIIIEAFMLPMQVRFYDYIVRGEQKGGAEKAGKTKAQETAAPEARKPVRKKLAA